MDKLQIIHVRMGEGNEEMLVPFVPLSQYEQFIEIARQDERNWASHAVMDLYLALKEINGTPTLKDLRLLCRRIRGTNNAKK